MVYNLTQYQYFFLDWINRFPLKIIILAIDVLGDYWFIQPGNWFSTIWIFKNQFKTEALFKIELINLSIWHPIQIHIKPKVPFLLWSISEVCYNSQISGNCIPTKFWQMMMRVRANQPKNVPEGVLEIYFYKRCQGYQPVLRLVSLLLAT